MTPRQIAANIDEYISWYPPETQGMLEEIRALIREVLPEATESISYAIPTFDLHGKHAVHFAGFEYHVGMYPVPSGPDDLIAELAPYRTGKGTLRFPLDRELPAPLMRRVIRQLADELEARLNK